MRNLVVSKPENRNLRCKNAINVEFDFSRKRNYSFIADSKLKFDQIKRKMEAKLNKSFFIQKSNIFKSQSYQKLSRNKLDTKFC